LNATDAVRQFLSANPHRAFLLSEVVARVRARVPNEPDVVNAVQHLSDEGAVILRSFPVRDPHLAFDRLEFVAAIEPSAGARGAELLTQQAYKSWLSDWLSSHRCC
jgi:hypothetical protein